MLTGSERIELDRVRDGVKALHHQIDVLVGEVRRLQALVHGQVGFAPEEVEGVTRDTLAVVAKPAKAR